VQWHAPTAKRKQKKSIVLCLDAVHNAHISLRRMLSMETVGGIGEGVDSNSLSRSETSINLFRAIRKAVNAILTFARVTAFRGDEDLPVSSGVDGSTDMPGTTAGGIDILLLSLPTNMQVDTFWVRICSLYLNRKF